MILIFCMFLIFLTMCKCGVMALYDDCKMFGIESKGMGIINLCVGCLLSHFIFMMGLCGIISSNGAIWLWVDDLGFFFYVSLSVNLFPLSRCGNPYPVAKKLPIVVVFFSSNPKSWLMACSYCLFT
jgi:hypothetical protein